MKYYKLTCIKDMPEIEAGFTCKMSEKELSGEYDLFDENNDRVREEKMYALRHYQDRPDYVKVEIDLSEAIPNLICPKCGKIFLFPYKGKPYREHDDGVDYYYVDISIECGVCDFKQLIYKTFTHSKLSD